MLIELPELPGTFQWCDVYVGPVADVKSLLKALDAKAAEGQLAYLKRTLGNVPPNRILAP